MKTPKSITIFSNGNVMAFDDDGQQNGDVQAKGWLIVYLEYLASIGIDPTEIKDIQTVVNGRQVYIQPRMTDGEWTYSIVDF